MKKSIIAILMILLCNILLVGCETSKEKFIDIAMKEQSSQQESTGSNMLVETEPTENADSFIQIDVDVKIMKVGEHIEYGPYHLKEGDKISCDISWSNGMGNLYIAIGTEFGTFDNGLIASGIDVCLLEENIEIKEDGTYYIYIGSQNTDTSDIKDIKGIINISRY